MPPKKPNWIFEKRSAFEVPTYETPVSIRWNFGSSNVFARATE